MDTMGETRNAQDYANAAVAVAAGTASSHQITLNDKAAKQAGREGNAARDANKAAGGR